MEGTGSQEASGAEGAHSQPHQQSEIGQVIAAANLMAGTTVNMRFIFGINTQVVNHLHFLEEHMIYYPAGHCVVFYNLEDRSQLFYEGQWEGEAITALAVSHNKKHIALAERSDPALIAIFDTHSHRRKKVLTTTQIQAREYVSVAFNPANKDHIIALTAEPDWTIILWEWQGVKPLIFHRVGVQGVHQQLYQVSFHPELYDICVVTGNGVFQYLRLNLEENNVETYHSQINQKEQHISSNYTCHIWLQSGYLLVGTNDGDLLLLQSNGEYMRRLPLDIELNMGVSCIEQFSRGFIVGGEGATMWIFERSQMNPDIPYKQHPHPIKSKVLSLNKVCCMAVTPGTEEYIYLTLNNNQLVRTPLVKPHDQQAKFEPVICDFHSKQITGLDVCVRKALFVTCGIDKSVRIWNYERRSLEIFQNFSEQAYSCAFHPSGLHVVVGFADKIRVLNVFSKTLRTYKEFGPKACREIRFSNGGHLFAAATNNSIQVFNFYTGEHPQATMNFRMHPGRVRCIEWKEDDSGFISGDTQGALYQWNLKESQKRQYEIFIKGSGFYGISKNPDGQQFFAVGSDKKIHVVSRGEEQEEKKTDAPMSQIVMSHNMKGIFALTSAEGRPSFIRCFKYPLSGQSLKFLAHADAGQRLRITHDDQFLISGGREGSLIIYNVNDKDAGLRGGKESFALPLSEEILTMKQELEELNSQIVALDSQNKDLENNSGNMKYEASIKELEEEIKSFSNQLNNQEFEAKKRHQELVENSRSKQNEDEEKMRKMDEQFQQEVERLKADHASRMLTDNQNYQKQLKEREEIQEKFTSAKNAMISEHDQIMAKKEEEHRMELEKLNSQIDDQNRKIDQMREQHQEILEQIRSDIKEEKGDIVKKNSDDVNRMNEIALKSKADLQLANNKKTELNKDIEQLQREIQDKQTTLDNQEKSTISLRKLIKKQAGEIKSKDDTIGEKERNIYVLKKKTQELDKFKFVLDYKIKELKKAIGPRESKIQELKNKTNDMDMELKKFSKINANFGLIVDDLRERQAGMQSEIKAQRTKIRENNNFIKKFKDDVYDAVQYIDEPARLKVAMEELKARYARDDIKKDQLDQDIKNEYQNQKQYLDNSVATLRKKLTRDSGVHKQDNRNIMEGNFELLREISDLRDKLKMLKLKSGGDLGQTKTGRLGSNSVGTVTSAISMMGGEKKQTKGKRDAIDRIVKERRKEIKIQEEEIDRLKDEVVEMRDANQALHEKKMNLTGVVLDPLQNGEADN